jgi:hypothetical protein
MQLTKVGQKGVLLVELELLKRGISVSKIPENWSYDLVTEKGVRIEVKFANRTRSKDSRGRRQERFHFRVTKCESKRADVLVLVLNNEETPEYYIVPMNQLTSRSISFNPRSLVPHKMMEFKGQWGLIENANSSIRSKL